MSTTKCNVVRNTVHGAPIRVLSLVMEDFEVLTILKQKQGNRSLRAFARDIDCSPAHLSKTYLKKAALSKKILNYLGLIRKRDCRVSYVRARKTA